MELIGFVVWEVVKVIGLVVLGLFSVKGMTALAFRRGWIKIALYALILVMAGVGAWEVGNDVAAEVYLRSCSSNLARGDLVNAYSNAILAIHLRPTNLSYWRALVQTKMRLQQLQSALDDEPTMQAISKGQLDEEAEYQFTLCQYFLGQYAQVVATTLRLTRENPSYAAPYVLRGLAYTAQKKYLEAQQSFLAVLQIFPNNQAAVEGLAQAFYLAGDRQRALAVLHETWRFPFSASARERFEALAGLYEQ